MNKLSEQECVALLPWYLNNTLAADERQALQEQLQQSADLQVRLQELQLLRDHLPKQLDDYPAAQLGWTRLQKQLHSEKQLGTQHPSRNPSQNNWSKLAAIAALLVLSIQVGWFAAMQRDAGDNIQLLGGSPVVVPTNSQVLQLQLDPSASWQDVVALVNALNADVVQGPSAAGIIHLRFAVDQVVIDGQPAANTDAVLQWLRAQPLVQHAALESGGLP